jgi:hypothetical protein
MIGKANINLISLNLRDIIHAEIVRKVKRRLITLCETPKFI